MGIPQGWKHSVKATHLVLALHDHLEWKVQHSDGNATNPSESQSNEGEDTVNHDETNIASTLPEIPVEDLWALEYITVNRVQSLAEALDDDGSSFVTVARVNEFTNSRPKEWR